MKVYTSLPDQKLKTGSIVALGNFDGVHVGHMQILRTTVKKAREQGLLAVCYTFANHPRDFLAGLKGTDDSVRYICTENAKFDLIEDVGIDILFNLTFDEEVMNTPAEEFIDDVLIGTLNAKGACCGFNYTFGAKAKGNTDMLRERGAEYGLELYISDPVLIDGEVVSSTATRDLIEAGDMELCAKYLGRPYCLGGKVISGRKLGRTMGFPTINFSVERNMALPPNGVYFSTTTFEGETYDSVTNIGNKPTVGGSELSIETNIFDFQGDIYGKRVRVEFLKRKRSEIKFDSIEQLREQIDKDVEDARAYHKARRKSAE